MDENLTLPSSPSMGEGVFDFSSKRKERGNIEKRLDKMKKKLEKNEKWKRKKEDREK